MQTRAQKRTEKAIAQYVGWVALPLDIIEKFIAHAVRGKLKEKEIRTNFNWYAERVRKYGSVCKTWKRAIIFSHTIFKRDKAKNTFQAAMLAFRQLNAVLKQLTKADHFEINASLYTQRQAKWIWELMRSVVHSNSRPKTIKFSCSSPFVLAHGREKQFDWGFINDTERLNVGSIGHLTIRRGTVPMDFFNKLADIDTVVDHRQKRDQY